MDGLRYQGAIEADVPDFHQDTTQVAVPPMRYTCLTAGLRTIQRPGCRDNNSPVKSMTLMHEALRSKNLPALDIYVYLLMQT